MRPLVLDACAALHAKQLANPGTDPITVIDRLVRGGAGCMTTEGVQIEQVAMTLAHQLASWREAAAFSSARVSVNERRSIRNELTKSMKIPGDRDIGLVALAKREHGVLLTHDDAAARLGVRCGVVTVDILDLADLVVDRSLAAWPDVESGFAKLATFAWQPLDWAGGVEATVAGRPYRERLQRRLVDWARARPGGAE